MDPATQDVFVSSATDAFFVGEVIEGGGIKANATIAAFDSGAGTITLSQAIEANVSGCLLRRWSCPNSRSTSQTPDHQPGRRSALGSRPQHRDPENTISIALAESVNEHRGTSEAAFWGEMENIKRKLDYSEVTYQTDEVGSAEPRQQVIQ